MSDIVQEFEDMEWASDAACIGEDPETFYPPPGRGFAETAKRICATCPVKEQCLQFALKYKQYWGVWGGFAEGERKPLHRDHDRREP